jgi:hypothetical protein
MSHHLTELNVRRIGFCVHATVQIRVERKSVVFHEDFAIDALAEGRFDEGVDFPARTSGMGHG